MPPRIFYLKNFLLVIMIRRKHNVSIFGDTKRLLGEADDYPEPILFREKLYVFDENGKRIGRFSLNIEEENTNENSLKVLYVHISNRAFINGNLSESIVTGTVTKKLKTLEEIRYECSDVPNSGKHERTLFLLREKTKYYLSITNKIFDVKSQTQATIPFVEAIGLIGESSNAILLRKLATKGYEGILCLKAVLSNGKRCKNYYVSKLSDQMVNGRRMQVMIIYRNITNHKKCNVTMTMALTRAGQIIYLFWSNSKCFLHIDPDFEVHTSRVAYGEPGLQYHWHKDIQLHSLYLDNVDKNLMEIRSFKYQYEELGRILGDFMQYVLVVKPKDIVCFAIQFFSAFGRGSLRKCPSDYVPQTFEKLYDWRVTPEWEGENFLFWLPGERNDFGEF